MRAAHDIGTQSLPGIAYAPRPDALPEAELSTHAVLIARPGGAERLKA
jgi:hypothetical protein